MDLRPYLIEGLCDSFSSFSFSATLYELLIFFMTITLEYSHLWKIVPSAASMGMTVIIIIKLLLMMIANAIILLCVRNYFKLHISIYFLKTLLLLSTLYR